MTHGFIRIGAAAPEIKIADCEHNREKILELMREADAKGCEVLTLPELCLTGVTCGDLFFMPGLIASARASLDWLARESAGLNTLAVIGLPWTENGRLYNCAASVYRGRVVCVTPKSLLNPGERRYFSAYENPPDGGGSRSVFGRGLIALSTEENCANAGEILIGIEIGDEAYAPVPPAAELARAGAVIVLNPSAESETAGKAEARRAFVKESSARLICAYARAGAGRGESTTDHVFSGHGLVAEHGEILAESELFEHALILTDVDTEYLAAQRIKAGSFYAGRERGGENADNAARVIRGASPAGEAGLPLLRKFSKAPFVPEDSLKRGAEVLAMQSAGLEGRLRHLKASDVVLALSGGLDSALALVVAARAFDRLGLPRGGICAVSMPCFGTSERTRGNAEKLAASFGASFMEIPIGESVARHFADIGHDPTKRNLVYENAQARERTQVAMDLAAMRGGFMLGTGDLSELALGFATYNGDHMSMYGVNASVPKTLIPHILLAAAEDLPNETRNILRDIIDTPVSPELLPPDNLTGEKQETESIVGPYALHDFFLYHMLRRNAGAEKILFLAESSFEGIYTRDEIKKWLAIFLKRFFANQFKRSCMPDGPAVGSVSLSPRGGWMMGSDAGAPNLP